jgi:hypothetical protein
MCMAMSKIKLQRLIQFFKNTCQRNTNTFTTNIDTLKHLLALQTLVQLSRFNYLTLIKMLMTTMVTALLNNT